MENDERSSALRGIRRQPTVTTQVCWFVTPQYSEQTDPPPQPWRPVSSYCHSFLWRGKLEVFIFLLGISHNRRRSLNFSGHACGFQVVLLRMKLRLETYTTSSDLMCHLQWCHHRLLVQIILKCGVLILLYNCYKPDHNSQTTGWTSTDQREELTVRQDFHRSHKDVSKCINCPSSQAFSQNSSCFSL